MTARPDVALFLYGDGSLRGGVARVVVDLAGGFADEGLSAALVVTGSLRSRPPGLRAGVRLVQLGSEGLRSAFFPLVRYLRDARPRSLVSSMEHANVLAVWARAWAGEPTRLVLVTHGMISERLRHMWGWRERVFLPPLIAVSYRKADAVVGVSGAVADDLRRFVPRDRVHRIYNPVVVPSPDGGEASGPTSGARSGRPVVLGAGRFTPLKDFPLLLEAFARARKERALDLVLLGDGDQKPILERRARELGVEADVSFPGRVDDPFPYYRRASVVVLSSRWEGFGNVLVEAMACGTPVVSTDCPGGPGEILENGRYGRMTPVGDAPALGEAILTTLDEPPDPERLRSRARDFSLDESVRAYRRLLRV